MKFIQRLKSLTQTPTAATATVSEPNLETPEMSYAIEMDRCRVDTSANASTSADQDSGDVESDFIKSLVALEHETKRLQLLMESVIPKHLIGELREAMMNPSTSNFQKSYLEYYESASILFADIVGFTQISSRCKADELVTMLNELFGRFDKAADSRRCLRIRILGDCYYCVSGVPPANSDQAEPHAKQCVEMGLDMIDILEALALELRVPSDPAETTATRAGAASDAAGTEDDEATKSLKMRIGIHTGQVVCGIMGKKKWQFDVHSSDVKLANHMEQGGLPGRVHITEVTLRHLAYAYQVEPAYGRDRDAYIASRDMDTYFVIAPPNRCKNLSLIPAGILRAIASGPSKQPESGLSTSRQSTQMATMMVDLGGRSSLAPSTSQVVASSTITATAKAPIARDTVMTINHDNETKTLLAVATINQDAAISLPHHGNRLVNKIKLIDADGDADEIDNKIDHSRLTTSDRKKSKSQQSIQVSNALALSRTDRDLAHSGKGCNSATSLTAAGSGLARFKRSTRKLINAKNFIRTIDPPFANLDSGSASETDIDKTTCDAKARRAQMEDLNKWTLQFKDTLLERAYVRERGPFGLRRLSSLALNYLKSSKSQLISLAMVTILILGFVTMIYHGTIAPSSGQLQWQQTITWIAVVYLSIHPLVLVALTLHHVYRAELKSRMDFIYHTRAIQDKIRLTKTRECNRGIFFNILPKHVAEHFLRSNSIGRELYSMPYESVGVLFATVTNFETFFLEGEANDHGKGCLNLLNEIICDFDDLLDYQHFRAIDKIKTIGTTYMTAIGLMPKQEDPTAPQASDIEHARQLKVLLELVMEMRLCLDDINRNSFGSYRLRAGINIGPVTAGVIGANKPQYDIWGNTVNVASRMESTCQPSKIQVTTEVYKLLTSYFGDDIEFMSRGEIDIKGKGKMETYYVELPHYKSLKYRSVHGECLHP